MRLRVVPGKLVVERRARARAAQGRCPARTCASCAQAPTPRSIVGDDVTDEDVFGLDQPGRLVTVRVGESADRRPPLLRPRAARYRRAAGRASRPCGRAAPHDEARRAEPRGSVPLGPALEFLQHLWRLNHALERALAAAWSARSGSPRSSGSSSAASASTRGMTAGQLAIVLHLDPGTVSAALRRLETSALLARRRDPRDRRRVTLALTAAGRALDRPAAGTVEHAVERLLDTASRRSRRPRRCSAISSSCWESKSMSAGHALGGPAPGSATLPRLGRAHLPSPVGDRPRVQRRVVHRRHAARADRVSGRAGSRRADRRRRRQHRRDGGAGARRERRGRACRCACCAARRTRAKARRSRMACAPRAASTSCFLDADLAYPPSEIAGHHAPPLLPAPTSPSPSRVHPDSRYVIRPSFFRYLYTRHVAGRLFNWLVRLVLLPGLRDTQAGLKGFTAAAAQRLFAAPLPSGFSFDLGLLLRARRLGLTFARSRSATATTASRRPCASARHRPCCATWSRCARSLGRMPARARRAGCVRCSTPTRRRPSSIAAAASRSWSSRSRGWRPAVARGPSRMAR